MASIESGTSFAHYRIIGPLGAGGMGEVYKAYDNSLERSVAIKILPPQLVKNEERLRRFVQEARAASSLNHPHIVTIHEIGEASVSLADGGSQSFHYIAMELIEGATLKRRIHADHADLRVILGYLAQAADGVAKAHTAGIVHRDLKPDNIMISSDGFAKVLDFGLAKLSAPHNPGTTGSDSTALWNETREGVIMGTVAYMSPEQVQGRAIDHRSDIFSFGSILYEAATLRRPFDADSDVELMHRILREKPQPIDEINPSVPAELRRVIRRCLAKDPEKRYQSMKDLAIELREISDEYDELSASTSSASSISTTGAAAPISNRRTGWALAAAALIAVAAVGFGAWAWKRSAPPQEAPASYATAQFKRLIADGKLDYAAISPDGRYLAFIPYDDGGLPSVFVRQIATGTDIQVVPPGDRTTTVTFSPDGNYIYYTRAEGLDGGPRYYSLYQVPVLGGASRRILHDVDTAISFSPDGSQFVFGRGRPQDMENDYVVVNADGSGERVLYSGPAFVGPGFPSWSPDGRTIAVARRTPPVGAETMLVLLDTVSGEARDLGTPWWNIEEIEWAPGADYLILTGASVGTPRDQIWKQPIDGSAPVRITNDFKDYAALTMTADGKSLVATTVNSAGIVHIGTVDDPDGGPAVPSLSSSTIYGVDASAANLLAVEILGDDGIDIAVYDIGTGTLRRLTNDGRSVMPTISDDGRTVTFVSEEAGAMHLYVMDSEGSNLRQLTTGATAIFPHITPNGRTIVYQSGQSMWKIAAAGGQPVRISERPLFHSMAASPDSRYAGGHFYLSGPDGPLSVFRGVPLVEGVEPLEQVMPSGRLFAWSPDGRAVHVARNVGGVDNIYEHPLDGSEPRRLTSYTSGNIHAFDWLPDGRLVSSRGEYSADVVLLTGF